MDDLSCAVCGREATRVCRLCNDGDAAYCSAQHQYSHWLERHKDECTYETSNLDITEMVQQKRTDLRAKAAHLCKEEFAGDQMAATQALCYALASLRSAVRRSHKFTQTQLPDCVLLASVLRHLGDTEGSAYFWRECAEVVSREPYGEWSRNKAVYEYAAGECEDMGERDAVLAVANLQSDHIERTFGKNQLDAADCALRICQTHVAGGDYDAALVSWSRAVSIQERHVAKADVAPRLVENYRFGAMLHTLAGKVEGAVTAGTRGRELARAGNVDKGLTSAGFSLIVGGALVSMGRLPEALGYFEEAYRTRMGALGEGDGETIAARKQMNGVRKALGYEVIPGPGMAKRGGQSGAEHAGVDGVGEEHAQAGAQGGEGGEGEDGGEEGGNGKEGESEARNYSAKGTTSGSLVLPPRPPSLSQSGEAARTSTGVGIRIEDVPRPRAGPGSVQTDVFKQSSQRGPALTAPVPSSGRNVQSPPSPRTPPRTGAGGAGSSRRGPALEPESSGAAYPYNSSEDGNDFPDGSLGEDEDTLGSYDDMDTDMGMGGEDGLDGDSLVDIDGGMGMRGGRGGSGPGSGRQGNAGSGPFSTPQRSRGQGMGGLQGGRGGGGGLMSPGLQAYASTHGPPQEFANAQGYDTEFMQEMRGQAGQEQATLPGTASPRGPGIGAYATAAGQNVGPSGMDFDGTDMGEGDGGMNGMDMGLAEEYGLAEGGGLDSMASGPGPFSMSSPEMGFGSPTSGTGPFGASSPTFGGGGLGVLTGPASNLSTVAAGIRFGSGAPASSMTFGSPMAPPMGALADGMDGRGYSGDGTGEGFNDAMEEVFDPQSALGMDETAMQMPGNLGYGDSTPRPSSLASLLSPSIVMGGGMVTQADMMRARAAFATGQGGGAMAGIFSGYGTDALPGGMGLQSGPGKVMSQPLAGPGGYSSGDAVVNGGVQASVIDAAFEGAGMAGNSAFAGAMTAGGAGPRSPVRVASSSIMLPSGVKLDGEEAGRAGRTYRLVDVTGGGVADIKVVPVGQKGRYFQDSNLSLLDEALEKLGTTKTIAGQKVTLRHVSRPGEKDSARERAKVGPRLVGQYMAGAAALLGKADPPQPDGGSAEGGYEGYDAGASGAYDGQMVTATFDNGEVMATYEHDGFAAAVPGTPNWPSAGEVGWAGASTNGAGGSASIGPGPHRPGPNNRPSPMAVEAAAMGAAAASAAAAAVSAAEGAKRASAAAAANIPRAGLVPGSSLVRPMYGLRPAMPRPGAGGATPRQRVIQVEEPDIDVGVQEGYAPENGSGQSVGSGQAGYEEQGWAAVPEDGYGRPDGVAVSDPTFDSVEQAKAYAEAKRREMHVHAAPTSSTSRKLGPGVSTGNAAALSALVPHNFGLGLVAVDSSAVGAANASGLTIPPLRTSAEAGQYLEIVTERLTAGLAALVQRADSVRQARFQGDGALAVPSSRDIALEGKEAESRKLQSNLSDAVQALAATSGRDVSSSPDILQLRDVLFTVIASVGNQVDTVLQGSNINLDSLKYLAAIAPSDTVSSMSGKAVGAGLGSSAGASAPDGRGKATGTIVPTSADAFSKKAAEMQAAVAAVRQETMASVAASQSQGDGGAGRGPAAGAGPGAGPGSGGTGGLGPGLGPGAGPGSGVNRTASAPSSESNPDDSHSLAQPGLQRVEANSEGRRMKAVFLTADEILASIQSRLLTLGLFKSLGNAKRQFRFALRTMVAGIMVRAVKQRKAALLASKVFAVGLMRNISLHRDMQLRACRLFALGALRHSLIMRNKCRRSVKVAALGFLLAAKRKMDAARRRTLTFAVGALITVHRTQGNPAGYKYGQKPTRKPVKAPRVRGIHWDTVADVKGSVWDRKSSGAMLRQLFPDLKSVFTEKEKEKKAAGSSGADDDAAKAKESSKPKEISFLEAKDSKNMAIALSKFKSIEGFKEGKRFEVVKVALEAMDEAALGGPDGVDILDLNLPTPEQLGQARDYQEDQVKFLAFAENYVWWMTKVPMLADRVKSMKQRSIFGENYAIVDRDVTIFSKACSEVLDNPRLVEFLVDVVRPFGNELNRPSGKKDAAGIRIAGLVKLGATKTADNTMTSLFYIVTVLDKLRPELLELCNEFKSCKEAIRLQLQNTETNFKALVTQAKSVSDAVARALKANDLTFSESIGPFAADATAKVAEMDARFATLRSNLVRVAEYLGEKEKDDKKDPIGKPEGLFAEWFGFVELLTKTVQEYRQKVAQVAKKKKEEDAKIAAAKEKAEKAAKVAAGGDSSPKKASRRAAKPDADGPVSPGTG